MAIIEAGAPSFMVSYLRFSLVTNPAMPVMSGSLFSTAITDPFLIIPAERSAWVSHSGVISSDPDGMSESFMSVSCAERTYDLP